MKAKIHKHLLTAVMIFITVFSVQAQLPGYLSGKATIKESPTLFIGNLIMGEKGELFLGSNQPRLQQKNTFFHVGNYVGEVGAKIYLSVADNSNSYGSRGFFDVVGTAAGSTEIMLDMFDNWDGSYIDLARAHAANSDAEAFTMQENYYNERLAQLRSRIEGNDRIWFVAELVPEDECLPLILQKKNNMLVVDNNPTSNGGYVFSYYKWFRNNEPVHEGVWGAGLGGIYNTGQNINLSPYDIYHVFVIDQYGNEYRACPYNPTIYLYETRIIAYPNPTTVNQSIVMVDVETNDEELLANGVITAFDLLGRQVGRDVRTNGHRITPIELPKSSGLYLLRFVSGDVHEVIKVVVTH
jgi:hypothetical protein